MSTKPLERENDIGDDSDSNTPPAVEQDKHSTVTELGVNSVAYNPDALQDFLIRVFHSLHDDEEVLLWAPARSTPGYPRRWQDIKRLFRSGVPRALYYGTSTGTPDEEGNLRNKHTFFKRLHAIVLDDIGTKIPVTNLPEPLREPSYVIETSHGNYQYGYVLATPIDNLEQAQALIQLMYDSGLTDNGGALPMKLVRLPGGVNNKPDDTKRMFPVALHVSTWKHWTPEELLTAIGSEVTWETIQQKGLASLQRTHAKTGSAWSPIQAQSPSLEGTIDPVLEWLYDEGYVKQETNEWATIQCPQGHLHTTGDDTAGYSPLGRGEPAYKDYRGFHCFHEHCRDYKIKDFLHWVAANGGPEVAAFDPTSELMREWVYDPTDDLAYQAFGTRRFMQGIRLTALQNLIPGSIQVYQRDQNKPKSVPKVRAWAANPGKLVIDGVHSRPDVETPLVADRGRVYLNTFTRPNWLGGPVDAYDVRIFLGYLKYLIPNDDERSYFINWLAAKFQNQGFRGVGIVMTTPAAGVGRGTLAKMLEVLLGSQNVATVPFTDLIDDSFNEWQLSTLAITHETLDMGSAKRHSEYRAYERLKTLIDPASVTARVNPKFRRPFMAPIFTSHLLFSNHTRAVLADRHDRRLYVITNPDQPARPGFFASIHRWLNEKTEDGRPAWAYSVGTYLAEATPDMELLMAPPPATEGKEEMLEASKADLDKIVEAILKDWKGPFISQRIVKMAIGPYAGMLELDTRKGMIHLMRVMERYTRSMSDGRSLRLTLFGERGHTPRLIRGRQREIQEDPDRIYITKVVEQNDIEALKRTVAEVATELS